MNSEIRRGTKGIASVCSGHCDEDHKLAASAAETHGLPVRGVETGKKVGVSAVTSFCNCTRGSNQCNKAKKVGEGAGVGVERCQNGKEEVETASLTDNVILLHAKS